MFGFFFGTLCLIGLVRLVARGRWRRRHGYYGHFHGHGFYRGYGPRGAVNAVLSRLDTAPGQEKVIHQALADFIEQARAQGREVRDTRRSVSEALRGERLDEARLNEVFGRHDAALDNVRRAGIDALRKVHEALDERQRKLLGDMLESGFGFGFGRHGHCGHGACC